MCLQSRSVQFRFLARVFRRMNTYLLRKRFVKSRSTIYFFSIVIVKLVSLLKNNNNNNKKTIDAITKFVMVLLVMVGVVMVLMETVMDPLGFYW